MFKENINNIKHKTIRNYSLKLKSGLAAIMMLGLNTITTAMMPSSDDSEIPTIRINTLLFTKPKILQENIFLHDIKPLKHGKKHKVRLANISEECINRCAEFFKNMHKLKYNSKQLIRWIKFVSVFVQNDYCPPENFFERLKNIPTSVNQDGDVIHCVYCGKAIGEDKFCSDKECISHWIKIELTTKKRCTKFVSNKSGWRERTCLLPVIIIEICNNLDAGKNFPAYEWAVNQLIEGKITEWEDVKKLFEGLAIGEVQACKLIEKLNSAYNNVIMENY